MFFFTNGVGFGEHCSGTSELEKALAIVGNLFSNVTGLQTWLRNPRDSGSEAWGKALASAL